MITGTAYKQSMRQSRSINVDEVFTLGMLYSNAPISEGLSRLIVNYDTDSTGAILTPRPGFLVKSFGLDHSVGAVEYSPEMGIYSGKRIAAESNQSFRQVIIGDTTTTKVENTTLYKGTGYIATVQQEAPVAGGDPNLVEYPMTLNPMQDNTKAGAIYYTKPETAMIHGVPLSTTDGIARQVGSYGFNNMYYYFAEETSGAPAVTTKRLMKTKLHTDGAYTREVVVPKEVSPTEAVQWGYNMLKENPFTFANENFAGIIQLVGLLPYDASGKIVMNPLLNQSLLLKAFYAGNTGSTYDFKWEWKDTGSSAYTLLKTERLSLATLPSVELNFSSPAANVIIQLTATKVINGTPETMPEKVIAMGVSFLKEENKNNVEMKNYDLSTASGMTYWQNRLVIWGVPSNPMSLFMSDINDPSYFPYPAGSDIFDEPIMHCITVNDTMLIFTSAGLYMLSQSPDGLGWYRKKIQSNLNISTWDIHLIQSVKGMVFFKSGNYYYMVVPSKMNVENLVVAPVSKNIIAMLDDFVPAVKEILNSTFDYRGSIELVHYYNFLDFEDVHNVYVFKTDSGRLINVMLLYNILSRSWRVHTLESQSVITPFQQDMTKSGVYMGLTSVNISDKLYPVIQFIEKDLAYRGDLYIPRGIGYTTPAEFLIGVEAALESTKKFRNYQFWDTGYRDQMNSNKKRYRELQFLFNNTSVESLKFFTDFFIDGEQRYSMFRYDMTQELDPNSPDYGIISLERVLIDPTILPGETVLAEDSGDSGSWMLDNSGFPEMRLWKIRMIVSGKGYNPRMRFVSQNEVSYEILNMAWVYRMMNAR